MSGKPKYPLPIAPNVAYGTVGLPDSGVNDDPGPMTFQKLADQYSQSLPLLIQLDQGYYGQVSQLTLCAEDKYQVHCVKYTKVVTVQDSRNNCYSVPLYSAFKFGIINASEDGTIHGDAASWSSSLSHSDVMSCAKLPKVLCVTKAWSGVPSLEDSEVLIVLDRQSSQGGNQDQLVVFSLLTRSRKILSTKCLALFSTNPSCTQLHLTDIAKYVLEPFPCQAFLYIDESALPKALKLPSGFLDKPVILVDSKDEVSLVLSALNRAELSPGQLLDVPVSSNFAELECSVLPSDAEAALYPTDKLMEEFSVTTMLYYKEGRTSKSNKIQSILYKAAQEGAEKAGIFFVSSFGVRSLSDQPEHKALATDNTYEELDWSPDDCEEPLPIAPTLPPPPVGPKPKPKPRPAVRPQKPSAEKRPLSYPARAKVQTAEVTVPASIPAEERESRLESEPEYIFMQPNTSGPKPDTKPRPLKKPVAPAEAKKSISVSLLSDRLQALESRLVKQEEQLQKLALQVKQLIRPDGTNGLPGSPVPPLHAGSEQERNCQLVGLLTPTQVCC